MSLFDWDRGNVEHVARHGVSIEEVEKALTNDSLNLDLYTAGGEERYESAGITNTGRVLFLVTTIRGDKIRVVTAFDAPKSLKRAFLNQDRSRYE